MKAIPISLLTALLLIGCVSTGPEVEPVSAEDDLSYSASVDSISIEDEERSREFLGGFRRALADHIADCGRGLSFTWKSIRRNFERDVSRW